MRVSLEKKGFQSAFGAKETFMIRGNRQNCEANTADFSIPVRSDLAQGRLRLKNPLHQGGAAIDPFDRDGMRPVEGHKFDRQPRLDQEIS